MFSSSGSNVNNIRVPETSITAFSQIFILCSFIDKEEIVLQITEKNSSAAGKNFLTHKV